MRALFLPAAVMSFVMMTSSQSVQAGEWMFRLKDEHVHLRKALFERNADEAWEHVDRSTRQVAGILAGRIRNQFDVLSEDQKSKLRRTLGINDDKRIRSIEGKHLLVAKFFLEAHPYMLVGDKDDVKLKDHGTRMTGPTAIVVQKNSPNEAVVPYRFTVESHFGGQAMDYRAQLSVPTLDDILGPAPDLPQMSANEFKERALSVFEKVRQAVKADDAEALWPLLDCDSQSQASHFADQAIERSSRHPEVAELLGISQEKLAALDGKRVWLLPWSKEELAFILKATKVKVMDPAGYDHKLLHLPNGYSQNGKPSPAESVVQIQSEGQTWQIPARINYRNGVPEVKLFIRPPFYKRLRSGS